MVEEFVLVIFWTLLVGGVVAGIILLAHHLEMKRDAAHARFVANCVIPKVKAAMKSCTSECMDDLWKKYEEIMTKMINR